VIWEVSEYIAHIEYNQTIRRARIQNFSTSATCEAKIERRRFEVYHSRAGGAFARASVGSASGSGLASNERSPR